MRILFIIAFISVYSCSGQNKTAFIEPYRLEISSGKTTNLIFPLSIKSVDRGSEDLLAAKADGSKNILHVKAAKDSLHETNLTVILVDGALYSFVVKYNPSPERLNIVFGNTDSSEVSISAKKISSRKKMFEHFVTSHAQISLQLLGIYVQNDVLFFQFIVQNSSGLSYEMESIRFFIRDKQKARRTASQETELTPLYFLNLPYTIEGRHRRAGVIALGKFSIPDNKYLAVHVLEKNGERDLYLKLNNIQIMKSKPL